MIDSSKWFYFAGGKSASSIEELMGILKHLPDGEFAFHVNGAKNDFANWVEGVFENPDLANELRRVYERKDTIRVLDQHLHRNHTEWQEAAVRSKSVLEHDAPQAPQKRSQDGGDGGSSPEFEVQEHKHEVVSEEPTVVEDVSDVVEPMKIQQEHELSDNELKDIVEETKHELEIEGRHVRNIDSDTSLSGRISKATGFSRLDPTTQFIVKEFIFGFALGLIFGLIMLGALLNVKCY